MVLKFDEPIPTKSGERVSVLWHELLDKWQEFKTARLIDDQLIMYTSARRIRELHDDLGITVADFPQLDHDLLQIGESVK